MQGLTLARRYTLAEAIGLGGTGTVYLATDLRTGGRVAVKVLHPQYAADPEYTARLQREAQIAATLTSPRVVRVIDLDEHDGTPFLVMEYVGGETLDQVLQRRGELPLGEALTIGLEVTRALEAAHAAEVVHRDLKPGNIKLVDGQVKVLDFGIARIEGDAKVTATGAYLGTPDYSAPERMEGRGDIRADIYALGAILFKLIAGRPPFQGPTPMAVLYQHSTAPPPPLEGDVPLSVQHLVTRCLAKDPRDRFQTPAELVEALGAALHVLTGSGIVVGATAAHPIRTVPVAAEEGGTRTLLPAPTTTPRHNLPAPSTSFVGRVTEQAEVRRLLATTRLLTLTGTGGTGKTRLALEVATGLLGQYRDGVWLVDLAALAEPSLVPQVVASALGVREQPGRRLLDTLLEELKGRYLLVVLDNCEHLLGACAALAQAVLDGCPLVQLLATSRELLGVHGETVWRVPSLAVPEPDIARRDGWEKVERVATADAVRLFIERAAEVKDDFALTPANVEAVAALCRRLDGIPLAIELAGARVDVVTVSKLRADLDGRVRLLTGTSERALSREQTLRLVLDWSYDLLDAPEQTLFRRLAACAGGFDAAAAAACLGDAVTKEDLTERLARLVRARVVAALAEGAASRYRLLESMRQYGGEKLHAMGEATAVHGRHRDWYLALAEQAESELTGQAQHQWLDRLETEHDNLRAALGWSMAEAADGPTALRLAGALWRFWNVHGHLAEGKQWLERTLEQVWEPDHGLQAKAHNGAGVLAFQQGEYARAHAHFEESLALFRELRDEPGITTTLSSLGNIAWAQGRFEEARREHQEALTLRRALHDAAGSPSPLLKVAIASSLNNLGTVESDAGEYDRAWAYHLEALGIRRGLDESGVAQSLHNLGEVAHRQGRHQEARLLLHKSLSLVIRLGNTLSFPAELGALARVAEALGAPEYAARWFSVAAALRGALRIPLGLTDRARYESSIAALRDAMGEPAFAAAQAAGQAMELDLVVAEALAWAAQAETTSRPTDLLDARSIETYRMLGTI